MITSVAKVVVPVDDQQRALDFWTRCVGFAVVQDETYGDERWIEVALPQGGPVLVLSPRPAGHPRTEVGEMLPHSPVFFTCEDIRQTHRELSGRGVEFPAEPAELPFGWWAMFSDPDGTRYALGQWS